MTALTEQQITSLAKLREPFPQAEIRYLPRVWCGTCRDMKGACKSHQKVKCQKCRNNISSAHIDLSYVGHAEATNRLLNVDPAWGWEPVAFDEKGLPQHDQNGGLWIRLTVCGVTRLGYGNADGKRGGDAVKEIIGDAIRNAGMRFGMALDLWTSSDLEIAENGPKNAPAREEMAQADNPAPERHLRRVQPGETDQWAAPAAGPQTAAQGRDYLHEATEAADADTVRRIWQEAKADGAVPEYLAQIVEVGKQKATVEHAERVAGAAPADDGYRAADPAGVTDAEPQDEHAAAVAELRQFATDNGITDIDAAAYPHLGAPLDDVSASAIRALTAQLRGNAA